MVLIKRKRRRRRGRGRRRRGRGQRGWGLLRVCASAWRQRDGLRPCKIWTQGSERRGLEEGCELGLCSVFFMGDGVDRRLPSRSAPKINFIWMQEKAWSLIFEKKKKRKTWGEKEGKVAFDWKKRGKNERSVGPFCRCRRHCHRCFNSNRSVDGW